MKGAFLIIFVVLITVFVAISHGFAKSTKEGSYIPHAWSQKLEASKRFEVVLDGGAVLDKETGLVWEKHQKLYKYNMEQMRFMSMYATRKLEDVKDGGFPVFMNWRTL